jgi:hypothetical protein
LQNNTGRTNSFEGTGLTSEHKSNAPSPIEGTKATNRNMGQRSNWQSAFPNFKQSKREGMGLLAENKAAKSETNSPVERILQDNEVKHREKVT